MRLLAAFLATVIAASVGAVASTSVRAGATTWLLILPAGLSMVAWRLAIAVGAKMPLTAVSYDVLAVATYLTAYWLLGDKLSNSQIVGAFVALCGIALMSYK